MTSEHYLKTKLLTWLPQTVAGLAAWGAMTLVSREWAAEVGLLVYFPVLVLMADGIDRERVKRFFEGWRRMPRLIGGEDTKRVSRSYHLNGRHGATAASPAELTDGLGQR